MHQIDSEIQNDNMQPKEVKLVFLVFVWLCYLFDFGHISHLLLSLNIFKSKMSLTLLRPLQVWSRLERLDQCQAIQMDQDGSWRIFKSSMHRQLDFMKFDASICIKIF